MSADKDGYFIQVEPIVCGTGVVRGVTSQPRQVAAWIVAGNTYLVGGSSLTTGGSFGIFGFQTANPILPFENFRGGFNIVVPGATAVINVLRKFSAGYE